MPNMKSAKSFVARCEMIDEAEREGDRVFVDVDDEEPNACSSCGREL